jgi:hypothetical protein
LGGGSFRCSNLGLAPNGKMRLGSRESARRLRHEAPGAARVSKRTAGRR